MMQTTSTPSGESMSRPAGATAASAARKVVVVNGSSDTVALLESVLDGGRYDAIIVESSAHAYSQIKQAQPNLVILCLELGDACGFQVLSMLKLDRATERIPVVTVTREAEVQADAPSSETMFLQSPACLMN
jgi:DNA-binding response OmpR family regulator